MGTNLLEHNQATLHEVESFIAQKQDCCVVNPCGSGKTAVMASVIRNHPNNTFTLITKQGNAKDYYLKKDEVFAKTVIITYNKLLKDYKDDDIDKYNTDFLLLDEAHYMGANQWYLPIGCIKKRFSPILIGFTATPQRFYQQGTQNTIVSDYFQGHSAGNFTSADLRKKGLFIEPECVVSYYNLDTELERRISKIESSDMEEDKKAHYISRLNEIQEKWLKESNPSIILGQHLPKYMYKEHCNRILVYAPNMDMLKKDRQLIMPIIKELFKDRTVKGYDYTYKASQDSYDEFLKEDNTYIKVLFSIDKIMETIHIDDLNIVIMLRPSVSNRIITQQYGRINNINNKNKSLIIDFVGNIDNLGSISFDTVGENREQSNKGKTKFSLNLKHIGVYTDLFNRIDEQLRFYPVYNYKGLTGSASFFAEVFSCDKALLKSALLKGLDIESAIECSVREKKNYKTTALDNVHDIPVSNKETQMTMEQVTETVNQFIKNRKVEDEDMQQDLYVFAYSNPCSNRMELYNKLNQKYTSWCKSQIQSEELTESYQEGIVPRIEEDDAFDSVFTELLHQEIDSILTTIKDREAFIIRHRYGLEDGLLYTLKEIGEKLNIHRGRVGQIEHTAIRKLRHPSRSRKLKSWLYPDYEEQKKTVVFNTYAEVENEDEIVTTVTIDGEIHELKTIQDYLEYSSLEKFLKSVERKQNELNKQMKKVEQEKQKALDYYNKLQNEKFEKERENKRKEYVPKIEEFMQGYRNAFSHRLDSKECNTSWNNWILRCTDFIEEGTRLFGEQSEIMQKLIKEYRKYLILDTKEEFKALMSCKPAPPPSM